MIGVGTQILGNITVGNGAKIGTGSVVLCPVPSSAMAVGVPARIIGFMARGEQLGSTVDMNLEGVEPLLGDANRLLKWETTTDSGSTDEMMEKDHSPETKLERANGGHVGDSKKPTSKEDKMDRGSCKEEEDENVTDSGRSLCPFSGYFPMIPCSVKKNCILHKQLRKLLTQEGCSKGECVEVHFEMLHCTPASSHFWQYVCIPLEIFSCCFVEIAKEKTRLDADWVQVLAEGGIRKLGLSNKQVCTSNPC